MDANKLEALREDYVVRRTCDLCEHANIPMAGEYGTCGIRTYKHNKHTGAERNLSIHRSGSCSQWAPDRMDMYTLAGFVEFLEKP